MEKMKFRSGNDKVEIIECKTRKTAWRRAPWAAKIVKVEGGFLAFATLTDFTIWRKQK